MSEGKRRRSVGGIIRRGGGSRSWRTSFYCHAATVECLHAGLSAYVLGAELRGRGADCAAPAGASSAPGLVGRLERFGCPPCALSGIARDLCTWQAVVTVGIKVHQRRLEVQLRLPLRVRVRLVFASPRVALHLLLPAACRRQPPRIVRIQPSVHALRSTLC